MTMRTIPAVSFVLFVPRNPQVSNHTSLYWHADHFICHLLGVYFFFDWTSAPVLPGVVPLTADPQIGPLQTHINHRCSRSGHQVTVV